MVELSGVLFQIAVVLVLIGLGYGVGHYREKRHFRRLAEMERELSSIGVSNLKRPPAGLALECCGLVTGQVVVATDYFKIIAASLRNLFGGEVGSLRTLVERARREAIVRALSDARERGADMVINLRCETSTVGGSSGKRQQNAGGVAVLAYGTALRRAGGTA